MFFLLLEASLKVTASRKSYQIIKRCVVPMAEMKKTSQHYHRQAELMVVLGNLEIRRSYFGMSLVPRAFSAKVLRTELFSPGNIGT